MKKFFSAFLLMTAMVLSVGTFVACNDLTEEMETVQTQATSNAAAIKALGDQITALQQALATANGEIEKAKAAGEEAKAAAAQAKADAIKAAEEECQELKAALEAKINENAQGLKDLTAVVSAKIAGIEEKLDKMATVAQVEKAVADLVKADTELGIQIEALKKYAADSLATIAQLEGLRKDLTELAQKSHAELSQLIGSTASALSSYMLDNDSTVNVLKGDVKKLEEGLKALEGRMTAAETAIAKINADLVTLKTFVEKSLRSLVFIPELYVDGIEATEYTYMPYVALKNPTPATTVLTGQDERNVSYKIQNKPADWEFVANTTPLYKNPVHYVTYFVNPDNADLTGAQLAFISKDVEAITKASAAAPAVAGDFQIITVEDGTTKEVRNAVRVPMTVTGKNVKGAKNASIFALNADVVRNGADTTVSSDFANLYASTLTLDAIAYAKANTAVTGTACPETGKNPHLYTTIYAALGNVPTLSVKYDGSIDLRKEIETHFTIASNSKKAVEHAVYENVYGTGSKLPVAEQNPYGLKWNFMLIDYTTGTNATSDSQHCKLEGSVLTPCGVTNGVANGVANPVSIGKRPLVRVTVTDEAGKIVLVGFIKLEITREAGYKVAETTPFETVFSCNTAEFKQTWAQFVDNVLEPTSDLSMEEFRAMYEIQVGAQYIKSGEKFVALPTTKVAKLGTVTENPNPTGTTTDVLYWNVTSEEQERVYENAGSTETIYVRYILKTSNQTPATEYEGIYVPLKVTVSKPVGKVTKKIAEYWFNNKAMINVQKPTDNGSTETWTTPINQVWEKNTPNFNAPKNYIAGTTYGTNYHYYFAAVQPKYTVGGVEYQLTVDNTSVVIKNGYNYHNVAAAKLVVKDNAKLPELELAYALDATKGVYANNTLYAEYKATPTATTLTKVEIATIDANGVITYERTDVAMLLLNAFASYTRDKAQLFANIGVVAHIGTCDIAMSLNENETNAYTFLRPINVEPKTGAQFVDAQDNGSTVNVMDLIKITDWRNEDFGKVVVNGTNTTYPNGWYFAYYDVYDVTVDVANAKCNLNQADGSFVKMSDVTNFIKLTHVEGTYPTTATYDMASKGTEAYEAYKAAYGVIKYENNGNNVNAFQIKVPVTFTYDWGKITVDAVIPVVKTMGN